VWCFGSVVNTKRAAERRQLALRNHWLIANQPDVRAVFVC
jgi:hypothetical protein